MLFWILTLAGIIIPTTIAIYFGLRASKNRKPVWAYATRRYIGRGSDAPRELKVYFAGREVQQVCITNLVFFNQGREIIRSEHVTDAIAIQFPSAHILKSPVIYQKSKEQNRFRARKRRDSIILSFLYLGHKDGAAIQILHDGDPKTKLEPKGNVMDADIKNINPFYLPQSKSVLNYLGIDLGIAIYFILIAIGCLIIFGQKLFGMQIIWHNSVSDWIGVIIMGLAFLTVFVFSIVRIIHKLREFFKFPEWVRRSDTN